MFGKIYTYKTLNSYANSKKLLNTSPSSKSQSSPKQEAEELL